MQPGETDTTPKRCTTCGREARLSTKGNKKKVKELAREAIANLKKAGK